jgi:hypothetical protein
LFQFLNSPIVKNNGISLLSGLCGQAPAGEAVPTENHQLGGRRAQSLYCAISLDCAVSLAEWRNKAIAPYEPTLKAQSASFNFANNLIWPEGSSAARPAVGGKIRGGG